MVHNVKKVWELPRAHRKLLAQAFLAFPLVVLGLRCFGLRRLQARLPQGPVRTTSSGDGQAGWDQARATARLVEVAARYCLFQPTCLRRSLVLWWLLRRQGLAAKLHIGVNLPEQNRLEAHAWVEYQGQVVNDSEDVSRRFAPFPREILPQPAPGATLGFLP
jgi:hypothetical protein